ncbi:hypothetical protein [Paenibacillus donghaensis]|uniref:Uncharacterized protein n=1 Tax=Paenibacillus donghaensis TaxID=414771 RepID=A0A2Z2KIH7_9BACL|nr:hypothetical protein [Paenibacillus donghaensis]ASA26014.1 hypothetical protein B9T62_38090 [Paenibacillus donghaensis]
MEWYTLGQMLRVIRLGQKAVTPDGRAVLRTLEGLFWAEGQLAGQPVVMKNYLFSDLWRIVEDEPDEEAGRAREEWERREREMLENQYEALREEYLELRKGLLEDK